MAFETRPLQTVIPPTVEKSEPKDSSPEGRDFDYDSIFGTSENQDGTAEPPSTVVPGEQQQQQPDTVNKLTEQVEGLANVIAQMQKQQAIMAKDQQAYDAYLDEPIGEPEEPEPDIDEYNMPDTVKTQRTQIKELNEKINTLENFIRNFHDKTEKTRANDVQTGIERAVSTVDKELADQGYDGFATDGRYHLDRVIQQLVAEGKQEQANKLYHSPQLWGEVWKRKIDQDFESRKKYRDGQTNKQQQKSQGQLIGSPGSNPNPQDNEDEDTVNVWENYARVRGIT